MLAEFHQCKRAASMPTVIEVHSVISSMTFTFLVKVSSDFHCFLKNK